jgi:hypothetical protein
MSENPAKPDTEDATQPQPVIPVVVEAEAPVEESQTLPDTSHSRETNPTPIMAALRRETQEANTVPEAAFLMNPVNEAIVNGESRQLPDDGSRWALLGGVPLLLVGIGLIVYTVLRWQAVIPAVQAGNAALPNTLLNGMLWTAAAFVVNLFVTGWYATTLGRISKRRRLQKHGQVVWGEVVTAVGKRNRADDLMVTVEYTFQRPDRRRKMLSGSLTERRNDLREKALPSPGVPVAILYLSPKNYELL